LQNQTSIAGRRLARRYSQQLLSFRLLPKGVIERKIIGRLQLLLFVERDNFAEPQ
jgi:hypothetical protein